MKRYLLHVCPVDVKTGSTGTVRALTLCHRLFWAYAKCHACGLTTWRVHE